MCDRWRNDFAAFFSDMGLAPEGFTIERLDGSKGYSPDNCVWASRQDQANNKSSVPLYPFDGKQMTLAQIGRAIGVRRETIWARLKRGNPPVKAFRRDDLRRR